MKALEIIHESRGKKFLFSVETAYAADNYSKYEELRREIGGDPEDYFASACNMASESFFHEGGSLFIGVFTEDGQGGFAKEQEHLVAFTYGYVGVKDREIAYRDPANLRFYSQYAGVRKDFRKYNLGIMLKLFQKEKVMDILGVYTINCTFDPLTGVNAYRNIHILGMDVNGYRDAHYEGLAGELNRMDVPRDRFSVSWDLKKILHRVEYEWEELMKSGNLVIGSVRERIAGRYGPVDIEIAQEEPFDWARIKQAASVSGAKTKDREIFSDKELFLVEIPFDFYSMLKVTDVPDKSVREIPIEWRLKTRKAFHAFFAEGYRIIDFRYIKHQGLTRDFYVFSL